MRYCIAGTVSVESSKLNDQLCHNKCKSLMSCALYYPYSSPREILFGYNHICLVYLAEILYCIFCIARMKFGALLALSKFLESEVRISILNQIKHAIATRYYYSGAKDRIDDSKEIVLICTISNELE